MTTPTDGERERLTCERCGGYLAGDSLDVCELCACKIELDTQYAELASLRAQVEGLRKDARRYRWMKEHVKPWPGYEIAYPFCEVDVYMRELSNGSVEKFGVIGNENTIGMASLDFAIDAAPATPQPVAKEK